ncbi:MAG: signal peptidase I [Clostridia bacterium]|nr:signal peptidase I [Clostridia bacterium]
MSKLVISRSALNRLKGQAEKARQRHPGIRARNNAEFFMTLIVILIFVMGFRMFIGEPTLIDGDSMYPTIIDTERAYVNKTAYWFENPQRGDIIICYYPNYTTSCVKRVIAVGGDIIEIRDGKIYINDELLDESAYWNDYINFSYQRSVVPKGHVFVIGDNRNNSKDSRDPSVGAIPIYRVVGKVTFTLWPLNTIRLI